MWALLLLTASVGALGTEEPPGDPPLLQALHCPPCERVHCASRRTLRLQCKGGVTTGVCGCCPVCARTEGEACGGAWDYLGTCDEGLVCVYEDAATGERHPESRGVCRAVVDPLDPESCRPDCTPEFCAANPSAVCSARSVSVERRGCQGSCQHTSCSACLLLRTPSCTQACAPSDSPCLQRFGKCVRAHLSGACGQNLQADPAGVLLCVVPPCPR